MVKVIELRSAVEASLKCKNSRYITLNELNGMNIVRSTKYSERSQIFNQTTKQLLSTTHFWHGSESTVSTTPRGRVIIEATKRLPQQPPEPVNIKTYVKTLTEYIKLVKPLFKEGILP